MIDGKAIILGFVVAIFLGIILGLAIPLVGILLAILLAGLLVGYLVGETPGNGASNGALTGILSGLFLGIIPLLGITVLGSIFGAGLIAGAIGLLLFIPLVVIMALIGAVGGALGGIISDKPKKVVTNEEKTEIRDETPPTNTAKIDFNLENMKKCLCSSCPVQEKSECSTDKILKVQEIIESDHIHLKADDVPGLHCATGKAVCSDLNFEEKCICGSCPIWSEYELENGKPMDYFCKEGKSR